MYKHIFILNSFTFLCDLFKCTYIVLKKKNIYIFPRFDCSSRKMYGRPHVYKLYALTLSENDQTTEKCFKWWQELNFID